MLKKDDTTVRVAFVWISVDVLWLQAWVAYEDPHQKNLQ